MKVKTVSGLGLVFLGCCVAACSGSDGAQGPAGTPGEAGKPADPPAVSDPSASLVSPPQGILDRELEVQIGGSSTKFQDGAKPDFGQGITVSDVTVSSPTLLVAKIKIAKDAKVGKRDVVIGDVTAAGAFTVLPAIDVTSATVAQGGVVQFEIANNDTKAFDTQAFSLDAPGVLDLGSQASSGQAAVGFVMAPPLATPTKGQVVVSNLDAEGKPRLSFASDPTAFEITPRAATVLAPGSSDQTFAKPWETKLFKMSNAANASSIVDLRMEVADPNAETVPFVFVFGNGGQKDDQLGIAGPPSSIFGTEPPPYDIHAVVPMLGATSAQDLYAVMLDASGAAGNGLKLTATQIPATKVAESSAAHDSAAPQDLGALPAPANGVIVDAALGAATEIDAYELTGSPNDQVQIAFSSAADLEVVVTKDPDVLLDDEDTPPGDEKVLADFFPGAKAGANTTVELTGQSSVYVVVLSDSQGVTPSGKYTFSARKLP
jgi:hypothetical protein